MLVLILGSSGFVGKNLTCFLSNQLGVEIHQYSKSDSQIIEGSVYDVIVNCVGVNRSSVDKDFMKGNVEFLEWFFTDHLRKQNIKFKRVIHISSVKSGEKSIYGSSKFNGEALLKDICKLNNTPAKVIQYTNLFGKWSKPDYNSVVATWCRDLRLGHESIIDQSEVLLNLTYIDEVCREIYDLIFHKLDYFGFYDFVWLRSISLKGRP